MDLGRALTYSEALAPAASRRATCTSGGIGRRPGFRFRCRKAWGFESLLVHSLCSRPRRDSALRLGPLEQRTSPSTGESQCVKGTPSMASRRPEPQPRESSPRLESPRWTLGNIVGGSLMVRCRLLVHLSAEGSLRRVVAWRKVSRSPVRGAEGCGEPLGECRPLLGGEWMDGCVAPWRHFTLENHFRRLTRFFVASLPLRKVEHAPPFVHVPLHEPGHRRDMRIPGPRGLIAVTVEAHSYGKRASHGAIPNRFPHHGRVHMTAPVRDELCGNQKPTCRDRRPLDCSRVCPAQGHVGIGTAFAMLV